MRYSPQRTLFLMLHNTMLAHRGKKVTHVRNPKNNPCFKNKLTFLKRQNVENIRFEKTCFEETCTLLEQMHDQ